MERAEFVSNALAAVPEAMAPALASLASRARTAALDNTSLPVDLRERVAQTQLARALYETERRTGAVAQTLSQAGGAVPRAKLRQLVAAATTTPVFLQLAAAVSGPLTFGVLPHVIESVTQQMEQHERGQFERWRLAQEHALQERLAQESRALQQELAKQQRDALLQSVEAGKLFENWPLTLVPSQILATHAGEGLLPLRLLLSPPALSYDRFAGGERGLDGLERTLTDGLREFLNGSYPLSGPNGAEFLAGAWDSKRFHAEASVKALFSMLRSEPVLMIELDADRDDLSMRAAYWGPAAEQPVYQSVLSDFPYRALLEAIAVARARDWEATESRLRELGRTEEQITQLGGVRAANLRLIREQDELARAGVDPRSLALHVQTTDEDLDEFAALLTRCICLLASWVLDVHYLAQADVTPRLPAALPALGEAVLTAAVLDPLVQGYEAVYRALAAERPVWLPVALVDLATAFAVLPDLGYARRLAAGAAQAWLALRRPDATPDGGAPDAEPLDTIRAVVADASELDAELLSALLRYYHALGDSERVQWLEATVSTTTATARATVPAVREAPVLTFTIDAEKTAGPAALTADGSQLITCSTYLAKSGTRRTNVAIRELPGGAAREVVRDLDAGSDVTAIASRLDQGVLYLACESTGIRAFNAATGAQLWKTYDNAFTSKVGGWVQQLILSPDRQRLFLTSTQVGVENVVWLAMLDCATGKEIGRYRKTLTRGKDQRPWDAVVVADAMLRVAVMAVADSIDVPQREMTSGSMGHVLSLPDGLLTADGAVDHYLMVNLETFGEPQQFAPAASSHIPRAITADGATLVTSAGDHVVLYDLRSKQPRAELATRYAGISADGLRVYGLAPRDAKQQWTTLDVWDLALGVRTAAVTLAQPVFGADRLIVNAQAGVVLVLKWSSGHIHLYDLRTGTQLGSLTAPDEVAHPPEAASLDEKKRKVSQGNHEISSYQKPARSRDLLISQDGRTIVETAGSYFPLALKKKRTDQLHVAVWRPFD